MPRLEQDLYSALSGSPSTDANARIYPDVAPQGAALPFIVYSRISTQPQNSLTRHALLDLVTMQVDCYASTKAGAMTLARQARLLLQGELSARMQSEQDDYEPDTKVYRHTMDFTAWEKFE